MRIVFEGLPGAGKTTHIQDLALQYDLPIIPEWVCFTDEQWRRYELRTPFYFANDEAKEFMGQLFRDTVVLFDRHYVGALAFGYALSTVLGDAATVNESYEANLAWYRHCLAENRLSCPDLVFVLDISAGTSLQRQPRARAFDDLFGNVDCLKAMRHYYHLFYAVIEPEVSVIWIDGEQPYSAVKQIISQHLSAVVRENQE